MANIVIKLESKSVRRKFAYDPNVRHYGSNTYIYLPYEVCVQEVNADRAACKRLEASQHKPLGLEPIERPSVHLSRIRSVGCGTTMGRRSKWEVRTWPGYIPVAVSTDCYSDQRLDVWTSLPPGTKVEVSYGACTIDFHTEIITTK